MRTAKFISHCVKIFAVNTRPSVFIRMTFLHLSQSCDTIALADSARLDELRARFIAVCRDGCDFDHPLGAVETSGGPTAFGDHNLQEAIAGVFPTLDACRPGCRAELIGLPGAEVCQS
jgi:hypothetical protein